MQLDAQTEDPRVSYDERRSRCPVSRDSAGSWTLYRHDDVRSAALDDVAFSSATSRFLQVPNGMDGAEHDLFRALTDRYFEPRRLAALEPVLADVAEDIVAATLGAPTQPEAAADAVELGARFAVRSACDWLGWPRTHERELLDWVAANREASRSGDLTATSAVATWYTNIIRSQTDERRALGERAPADVTTELLGDDFLGRALTDEEITSILRNWTGGDLSSMALCIGVVLAYLADHPQLQARMRAGVSEVEFNAILDEILRIDNPFTSNRRVTTREVALGDERIPAGDRVVLNWTAANRDPEAFGDPDAFSPYLNAPKNLVYGIGRHVCPGRALATMQLRLLTEAVLYRTAEILPDPDRDREREQPPAGGYARVPIVLRR
ncbi:cytochrome P450 [Pseudactinotalea sp. HY158]|uniref:cytochrome P450 n=1 Tax=Pseudactinotalea sp. HY158 TaxID=2654547 RepID=UPI00129CFCBF|nr:cytochrome P450 [Pseudactinotalea sp. HY158]QGH68777.1 cytochrome P450 [Pseudactinotalea sp. HY158]